MGSNRDKIKTAFKDGKLDPFVKPDHLAAPAPAISNAPRDFDTIVAGVDTKEARKLAEHHGVQYRMTDSVDEIIEKVTAQLAPKVKVELKAIISLDRGLNGDETKEIKLQLRLRCALIAEKMTGPASLSPASTGAAAAAAPASPQAQVAGAMVQLGSNGAGSKLARATEFCQGYIAHMSSLGGAEEYQKRITEIPAYIEELQNEKADLHQEVQRWKKQKTDADEEIAKLKQSQQPVRDQLAAKDKELKELQMKLDTIRGIV